MAEQIASKEIQKIAEAMQSFKGNQTLLVSFLPLLTALIDFLKRTNHDFINQNVGFSQDEISQFESVAQIFHVLCYDCIHNNPTPDTITLAQVCSEMENICLTAVQHSKGVLNEKAGHFYASEQNLQELTQASLDVLRVTDTKEPIAFFNV